MGHQLQLTRRGRAVRGDGVPVHERLHSAARTSAQKLERMRRLQKQEDELEDWSCPMCGTSNRAADEACVAVKGFS
ncbi:unnamed protein product, partial [Chrysoparadoxa australica]